MILNDVLKTKDVIKLKNGINIHLTAPKVKNKAYLLPIYETEATDQEEINERYSLFVRRLIRCTVTKVDNVQLRNPTTGKIVDYEVIIENDRIEEESFEKLMIILEQMPEVILDIRQFFNDSSSMSVYKGTKAKSKKKKASVQNTTV